MFSEDIKSKITSLGELSFTLCMLSREQIVVSGVKRILLSNEQSIVMRLKSEIISISGNRLQIKQIGSGDVYIHGMLKGVSFEEK